MGMESFASRVTDKYICLMLLVFPLWTGFDGYAQITRWKFIFFAVTACIWYVLIIFSIFKERSLPRVGSGFAACLGALLLWAALSFILSPYGVSLMGPRYDGLLPMALYILTALGCAAYGSWHDRYAVLLGISVSICCAVAVLQLLGFNPLRLYPEGYDYYGAGIWYNGSFLGTLGNTNLLGAFLCLACPALAFTAALRRGHYLWLLLPAALGAAVTALSRSEAGLVGLAAALLAGTPYYVNLRGRRRAALIVLAAETALVIAALLAVYAAAPASGTLYELSEILHGRIDGSFGSHRVAIWGEALRLFAERSLLGGGPGTFALRSTLQFSRFAPESGLTFTTVADNAHCEALACLADLGLPGALLYLAAWAVVLRCWLRGRAPAAGTALLSYFVQSLFGIGTCFVLPLTAILCGLTVSEGKNALT